MSEQESDSSIIYMLSGSFSLGILFICLTSFRRKGLRSRGSLNTVWYAQLRLFTWYGKSA
nr:hypothetical protein Q903MT_gene5353 [Picea sitchensis]